MNIIEQIDEKFRANFASDYCEVVLTNGEWQQIKEAFEKVREDALEEAAKACHEYHISMVEQIRSANPRVSEHLQISREGRADAAKHLYDRIRALKDGE